MIAETLACILLVLVVAAGLARPAVERMGLSHAEALVAGAPGNLGLGLGFGQVRWDV